MTRSVSLFISLILAALPMASFGAEIGGKIIDKDAQPLAGCAVSSGGTTVQSSDDGTFATPGDADDENVRISCQGFAPKFMPYDQKTSDLGNIVLKRPNFVFILADDLGWVQTSTQMDPTASDTKSDYFRTPYTDALLGSGMTFTRGYAPGTYCLPTRRSLQVSRSTLRHAFNGASVDEWTAEYQQLITIPRVLKSVDPEYTTAHLGKWDHRFDLPDPSTLGYDVSDGATGNGEGNVDAKRTDRGRMDRSALNPSSDPKAIFDLTRRAGEFMDEQVENDRPFYLQVSHYAVHLAVYFRPETYEEVLTWEKSEERHIPSFAAMLKDLDDGIGLLRQHIADLGIEDNTYIIFMSDNGGRSRQDLPDGTVRDGVNIPLSEGKHSIYEGGIRVPFAIMGPGIEPGSYSATPISGVDILPTIADIVGAEIDLGDIDGGSFRNVVYQQSDEVQRLRPYLVFHDKEGTAKSAPGEQADSETALMQGEFKLIKTWKDGVQQTVELYNIAEDEGEAVDLTDSMPELTEKLSVLMDDYISDVGGDVTIDTD